MKCKIQWIDDRGQPTPDDNEAVAIAHYHKAIWLLPSGGPGNKIIDYSDEIKVSFPICQEHLDKMKPSWKGWSVSSLPMDERKSDEKDNCEETEKRS
jgi:hypothetical protein